MKKFSKLVKESKLSINKDVKKPGYFDSLLENPGRFVNIVDWEERVKPIIELFEENDYIFTTKTKTKLVELLDLILEDYKVNWIDEVYDGSQESFFGVYEIKADYRDILDCIQPLLDISDDTEDNANFEWGAYHMRIGKPRFKNLEDLIEDVADVHGKLQMLNVDFKIHINTSSNSVNIFKNTKDIDNYIPNNWKDSWGKLDKDLSRLREIEIFIYNKDTVEAIDLKYDKNFGTMFEK